MQSLLAGIQDSGARANAYLRSGRVRRWRWYWAFISSAVAAGGAVVLAAILQEGFALFGAPFDSDFVLRRGEASGFLAFAVLGTVLAGAAALALRLGHGHPLRYGFGASERFHWDDFGRAAAALGVLFALSHGFGLWNTPDDYRALPKAAADLPWMLLVALAILPQAFGEEYAFRGYLVRVWGAVLPVRAIVILAIAGVFSALHLGNADLAADIQFNIVAFLVFEVVTYLIYFRTENLSATTGLHWANNTALFVGVTQDLGGGQPIQSELALYAWRDPVLAAGGSRLYDGGSWLELIAGVVLLSAAFWHPRSPFYLRTAEQRRNLPPSTT